MRNFLRKLMYGRYGYDQLNLFLLILCLICWILCTFLKNNTVSSIFSVLGYALILFSLFRSLSRNYDRRRSENNHFLSVINPVTRVIRQKRAQTCDRDHKYFRCPNCGQLLRAPKGKGKISVSCRNCGASFQKKT